MTTKLLGLMALGLLAGSISANATPITATAVNTYVFNFDFLASAAIPAPDYNFVSTAIGTDDYDGSETGSWDYFSELGATGTNFLSFGLDHEGLLSFDSGWTDGIFSLRLIMTSGSITVDPSAEGYTARIPPFTQRIYPIADTPPTGVPEPGTLALLGLGLLGLGVMRRKVA